MYQQSRKKVLIEVKKMLTGIDKSLRACYKCVICDKSICAIFQPGDMLKTSDNVD